MEVNLTCVDNFVIILISIIKIIIIKGLEAGAGYLRGRMFAS